MTMFFLLIVVTLVAGLGVAYLLNKWFRSDMEKCKADITASAAGDAGSAASTGPPVPKLNAKLYGAVAVFAVVVMFVGGAGLYQLNRDLRMKELLLAQQEKKLKEVETWRARLSVRLDGGATINPAYLNVKVEPPEVDPVLGQPTDTIRQFFVSGVAVQKPARNNLPTLTVSYPGYEKCDVNLGVEDLIADTCYDTAQKIVTVPGVITLAELPRQLQAGFDVENMPAPADFVLMPESLNAGSCISDTTRETAPDSGAEGGTK